MTQETFDPVKHGQQTAKVNAQEEAKLNDYQPEAETSGVKEAQKTAEVNAETDKENTNEPKMVPVKVSTSEIDTPEGAPVTTEPQPEETNSKKRKPTKSTSTKGGKK